MPPFEVHNQFPYVIPRVSSEIFSTEAEQAYYGRAKIQPKGARYPEVAVSDTFTQCHASHQHGKHLKIADFKRFTPMVMGKQKDTGIWLGGGKSASFSRLLRPVEASLGLFYPRTQRGKESVFQSRSKLM